ncbi:MAG: collagen-like protein, partial [Dehalococcoidia bacterium]
MFTAFLNSKFITSGQYRLIAMTVLAVASISLLAACEGTPGSDGPQGATGAPGAQGEVGQEGDAGPKGGTGSVGEKGAQGDVGATGATGPAGSSSGIEVGEGLTLVGDSISADLSGTGDASTISRSDHDHDTEYYARTAVDSAIAAVGAWGAITDIPSGFADGEDSDSLAALSCSDDQFVTFTAGAWACGSVSSTADAGTANTLTNVTTTLASNVANGQNMSMKMGIDDLPFIAYYDRSVRQLITIHCTTADCSSSDKTTQTSAANAGEFLDMAIGLDGRPVISMYDNSTNA